MNLLFKISLMFVLHTSTKGTFLDFFEDVGESPHYLLSLQHRTKCKTKINPKLAEREGEEESCAAVAVRLRRHHRRKYPLFFSISIFLLHCTLLNHSRARIQRTAKCVYESIMKHKVRTKIYEEITRIIEVCN